ncbi:MAG: DNA mismatch repair protein MutL, partial [Chloroflexota bacterium]|nr:DNA mismatch repair protein MutL [Chloroflexota bacterium]
HGTLPVLRVLGQIKNTYIVAEGPEGAYLIDQHAAHERVVFEQVKERSRKSDMVFQTLLEPRLIRLDQNQIGIFEENLEIFQVLGMNIEPFGPETFRIRSIPSILVDADPVAALIEVLDILGDGLPFESWEEKAAYSVACHGAIRAGKSLSMKEMEALTRQLESCEQPNSCPHGRPTILHLTIKQLERDFGR